MNKSALQYRNTGLEYEVAALRRHTAERPAVDHDGARVAVLAVCLMLKDRNDHAPVAAGADLDAILNEYGRIEHLRASLGHVTAEELEAATALWDLTAQ